MPTREYSVIIKDIARVHLFPVRRKAQGKRGTKNKPTSETQNKLNQKNREHKLADLLHLNFTANDLFIRLSYAKQPESIEAAEALLCNYFRRVRYYIKKHDMPPLKYIYITEQGSKSGRIHHHVFISGGIDRDIFESLWGLGYANSRRLEFNENGLIGLTKYVAKGKKTKHDKGKNESINARTWNSSHNLIKPQPRKEIFQNDYRIKAADVVHIDNNPEDYEYIQKLYPDYNISHVETTPRDPATSEDITHFPRAHFITIYLYRKDAVFLKKSKNIEKYMKGGHK